MIKKLWVKFEDMDVACVCDEHHRKCKDKSCKEYVVKFTEIERSKIAEQMKGLEKDGQLLEKAVNDLKKYSTELKKSITKFKI